MTPVVSSNKEAFNLNPLAQVTPTNCRSTKVIANNISGPDKEVTRVESAVHVTPNNHALQGVTSTDSATSNNVITRTLNENDNCLPDLAVYKPGKHDEAPTQETLITHDNSTIEGEFSFSPLSSKDEPVSSAKQNEVATSEHTPELVLTEEEDNAVSALLSLSRSIPSEASSDVLDNSELMPIGKKTIDTVPVPIKLSTEDVKSAIAKHAVTVNSEQPTQATTGHQDKQTSETDSDEPKTPNDTNKKSKDSVKSYFVGEC